MRWRGIRPEHLLLCEPGQGLLTAKVEIAEYTGASSLLHVVLDGGEGCLAICEGAAPKTGAQVGLAADPANLHFFDAEGQALRPA